VVLAALALALGGALLVAAAVGSVAVPLDAEVKVLGSRLGLLARDTVSPQWDAIFFLIRLPRVLGAALIGGVLAVAGASLQALLRNPMADPGVLGVSAGAGFGAVAAIGLGLAAQSLWVTPVFAVLGALVASSAILGLTLARGPLALLTLILAGIAVSTFFGAGTSLILSLVSRDSVAQFVFWSMGSLSPLRWETLGVVAVPTLVATGGLLVLGRILNVLLLGDDEARSVGVEVNTVRILVLVLVSVATAGAVCICGPISFVGLLVPPLLRLVLGPDNRTLLPASALGGALFLVVCDALSRVVAGAQEVNIGVITALLGAPYFLFLLVRRGKGSAVL
jgi:iron complex transport system permease protein